MQLIHFFQGIASPFLNNLLFYVTELGSTKFYLVIVPIIYWCINRRAGYSIGMTVLAGGIATDVSKGVIGALRPFQVDPSISVTGDFLESATGSGMPSGHSFNSMAFWSATAMILKRSWFWALSAVIVLLIGFSRVYSGVHFPLQVAWGWAGGLSTAVLVNMLLSLAHKRIKGGIPALALLISGIVLVLYSFVPALSASTEDYIGLIGIAGGMSLGYFLHSRYVGTEASGALYKQVIKAAIGLAGFVGLRALADMGVEAYPTTLLPSYFLLGLWPSVGATVLFKLLRLEKKGD